MHLIGSTLGHYQITAKIGEGGMGEVYRARDTQLDREVAIKVLSKDRLDSDDARMRFEREAKAVAALSHPNILAIYEFGEHNGMTYAVTELLEGASLLEQLQKGPLPLRRALDLAAQMADGLAAAHDKGIIHRDIKPGNVFLTKDGRLKILDFGLAKSGPISSADTIAATVVDSTKPGTLLGTVRYMSPEQVRGEAVDHRSDIFSFGTVLWQMLSAQVPFERASGVETMNAILHEDLDDPSTLISTVTPAVDRILHRCLEKSAEQRFQSAHDLGFALRTISNTSSRSAIDAAVNTGMRRRVHPALPAVAILFIGMMLGAFLKGRLQTPATLEPVKVVTLTHSGRDWAPSASPDGKMIAFTSDRDGTERIWLRQMQGGVEAPLTEESGFLPKFSPDGSSILYMRDEDNVRSAYRVSVVGGLPRKLLDNVANVTWAPEGNRIAFVRAEGDVTDASVQLGIYDIQAGTTSVLANFANRTLYGLQWSPDGKWILAIRLSAVLNNRSNEVVLVDATNGETRTVLDRPFRFSAPCWTPDSKSILVAQSMSLLGDMASPLGRLLRVDTDGSHERALFWVESVYAGGGDHVNLSPLPDGSLVFDEISWRGSLTEVPLDGAAPHRGGRHWTEGNSRDRQPSYSPDGSRIVFSSNRSGNLDLWILERNSGILRQVTDDEADDWDPAFTVDGQSILWSSNRGGPLEIWTARADGSAARQLSNDGEDAENPTQTADGKWIVYTSGHPDHSGVWKMRSDGSDATLIAAGSYLLTEVAPDSRHVSYCANEVQYGRIFLHVSDMESNEIVFTTDMPFTGLQSVVQPGRSRWMPDGKTLVFVGLTEDDRRTLFAQDFRPGEDTRASRILLIDAKNEADIESFAISPDGRSITVARIDHSRTVKLAVDVVHD